MSSCPDLSFVPPRGVEADLLIVGCFEGEKPPVGALDVELRGAAERLVARSGWRGRDEQYAETELDAGPVRVIAVHGLGKRRELTPHSLSTWLWRTADRASAGGLPRLALLLPEHAATVGEGPLEQIARGLLLATYRFERFVTDERLERPRVREIQLVAADGPGDAALARVLSVVRAVCFARDLANSPANEADPQWMEERARELAEEIGMSASVLDRRLLEDKGMGGLLAVGAGSRVPPRLVRLDWGETGPSVALVGKGVTFDAGGISIKPALDMDEMKFDKCGACTVLAIGRAVAELGLPLRLSLYLPLAENMPDGASYRPGDVIRAYDGQTIEITNTDAEGRLILADALAWAVEEKPDLLLEYSTLTGASVVALGQRAASLYTPDDQLAEGLLSAAESCGDRLWRMPLWPEFGEQMKGAHADLRNSAGRWGAANTAAAFLGRFVGDHPRWAHLDIAGGAYVGNNGEEPKGATGYGVAFTVAYLRTVGR